MGLFNLSSLVLGGRRIDGYVQAWTEEQIAPWVRCGLSRGDVYEALTRINAASRSVYLFEIIDGTLSMLPKPMEEHEGLASRARTYHDLLQMAVRAHGFDKTIRLAIDVEDGAPDRREPVFSFQKLRGHNTLLLPDVELLTYGFYEEGPADSLAFPTKACRASFSGSTTGGGLISLEDARAGAFPRLRAARRFRNETDVDFRLTQIVQCATPEAESFLRSEGFGQERTSWSEAFQNKFLISIDGNGAACSRPVIALRCQSALLKYDSDYVVYYSSSLTPWLHYIPIRCDEDVITVVRQEKEAPGRYQYVAEAGKEFGRTYLGKKYALAYTASMLRAYEQAFLA